MTDATTPDDFNNGIKDDAFENIMGQAFIDYSMSVITSRALPDVRDGLKPVHRRILYTMHAGGYTYRAGTKKSARIVGEIIGKYHPHGDQAVYETMVRMAQPWKQFSCLVEGQGNFGNLDGDGAAAMRYTEARMSRLGHEMTADLDNDRPEKSGTVDFRPNYDGTELEPKVLPTRFPNILVNAGSGIAVGMASSIPTHNLGETIDASLLILDNPNVTVDDILNVMPGPDFPTGGIIMGKNRIREAYLTGRGSIPISGISTVEETKRGRQQIVITQIPFDVVKQKLVEKIGELVNDKESKVLDGVTDVRDESTGESDVRIVIEIRNEYSPEVIVNMLRKHTEFQTNFAYNATCLSPEGEPRVWPVTDMLSEFIKFRQEVVFKRTLKELDKKRDEQIKQIAIYAAISQVDEIVSLIRHSRDDSEAHSKLCSIDFPLDSELKQIILEADPDAELTTSFKFNEVQADAVLRLSLSRLTGLAREQIADTLRSLAQDIRGLVNIIENNDVLNNIVRNELIEVKAKHGKPRQTQIMASEADDIDEDSLVEQKDVVVTLTKNGYVKRTELSSYRAQRRGGKGKSGMETREEDFVIEARVCTTRTHLLVFTSRGQAYTIKTWKLPEAAANAKGRPIINFIELKEGEKVTSLVPLPESRDEIEHKSLIFVTDFGSVRRNRLTDFMDLRKGGKSAMPLEDDRGNPIGKLVAVLMADDQDDLLIATSEGMSVRFAIDDITLVKSRAGTGVRGITLKRDGDVVVDACILAHSDANAMERDVYLSGGSTYIRLINPATKEPKPIPESITIDPAPEDDKPDRALATLSIERMNSMRVEERYLLTITANGFGKRSSTHEYRVVSRGGSGVTAAEINEKTGRMVSCLLANDTDQLVLMTDGGQAIRTKVSDISVIGRNSRGVRLLNVPDGQNIASVALVASAGTEESEDEFDETSQSI